MAADLFGELKEHFDRRNALIVVGPSVPKHASAGARFACWKSFLEYGADLAARAQPEFRVNRYRLVLEEIASNDLDNLCSAAGKIERALGGRSGGEFRRWLTETIGGVRIVERELLAALRETDAMLATLNYDSLLETTTGLRAVSWCDGGRVERVGRGDEPGILHLFGVWQKPESVLVGVRSYQEVVGEPHVTNVLRALEFKQAIVFVGCGFGPDHPNYEAFRSWLAAFQAQRPNFHRIYCLVADGSTPCAPELDAARDVVVTHGETHFLTYGERDADLIHYLRRLVPNENAIVATAGASQVQAPSGSLTHSPPTLVGSNSIASRRPSDGPLLRHEDSREQRGFSRAMRLPERARCLAREQEIALVVDHMLRPAPGPLAVLGPPGIGKSAMALEALYDARVAARYASRRWLIRCEAASSAEAMLLEIGRKLDIRSSRHMQAAVTARLAEAPTVLVLDHIEGPWHKDVVQVEQVLASLMRITELSLVATVCGHDRPLLQGWADSLCPSRPSLESARRIFLGIAGGRFASDPDLANLLVALDCLPLAIALVAGAVEPDQVLREELEAWNKTRAAMLEEPRGPAARATVMDVAFERLLASPRITPQARRLLGILAQLPAGVPLSDAEHLIPKGGEAAARILRRLGIVRLEDGRFRLPCALREQVARRLQPSEHDAEPIERFYIERLVSTGAALDGPDGRIAFDRLAPEIANVEAVLGSALARCELPASSDWLVPVDAWKACLRQGCLGTATPLLTAAARFQSATDRVSAARCDEAIAAVALSRSRHDEAYTYFEQALAACRQAGDVEGEARCLLGLAELELARKHDESCSEASRQALLAFRTIPQLTGEAECLRLLGEVSLRRKNREEARDYLGQALALYRRAENVRGEAECIVLLGDVAREDEEAKLEPPTDRADGADGASGTPGQEASKHYEQALSIVRQTADVELEIRCLRSLASVAFCRSEHGEARQALEKARTLCSLIGDLPGEANCFQRLAKIELAESHDEAGRQAYERALRLFRQAGDRRGEGHCAELLGNLALCRSRYREARKWYEAALPCYRQAGRSLGEANCIQVLGSLFLLDNEFEQARRHYEQALEVYRQSGDVLGEGNCVRGLGEVAAARSDSARARLRYEEALALYERIADAYSIGAARLLLARVADTEDERAVHVNSASAAWQSIARADLLEILAKEFGKADRLVGTE